MFPAETQHVQSHVEGSMAAQGPAGRSAQREHGARGEGSGRRGALGQVMQDLVWHIKGSVGQERLLGLRLRKWVKGETLEGLERRGKDCVGLSENQTASGSGLRR